jgi:hypothetical protein
MSPETDLTPYEIPDIYVSEPGYDDMGEILDQVGVSYRHLSEAELDDLNEGIVMVNCDKKWAGGLQSALNEMNELLSSLTGGTGFDELASGEATDAIDESLGSFVERGGSAIVSDFAGELLTAFTEASFDNSTQSKTVNAKVDDNELAELLGKQKLSLEFDLGGWYKPDTIPSKSTPLLRNAMTDEILAYKFQYGNGEIVYTAFHNHAQATEVEKALLKLLLMIPIADSTGTTLKDTYTTITGETVTEDATVIKETVSSSEETTESTKITFDIRGGGTIEHSIDVEGTVSIGRADFEGVVPEAERKYISRTHLEIRQPKAGRLQIKDANSSNGTKLNEEDISDGKSRTLQDGAEINLAEDTAQMTVYID